MKSSALIAAAKRDAPRRNLEHEVLGAIGLASTALAPTFAAKLWTALKHAAVSKIGVSAIALTAASGGYIAGRLQERALQAEAPAPAPTLTSLTPARVLTPTPTETQTPAPTQTPAQTPAQTQTPPRTLTPTRTATSVATTPSPPPPPSLAAELASIRSARESLLARDGHGAIAALDAYDRANANGKLAEESLALRVRAARMIGDDVMAAEALTKLETRFPSSVHLASLAR